jgi:hypothetical protein
MKGHHEKLAVVPAILPALSLLAQYRRQGSGGTEGVLQLDGCNFSGEGDECSTLYVTDIGAPGTSPFAPNIIKATPAK